MSSYMLRPFIFANAVNLCTFPVGYRHDATDKTPHRIPSDIFVDPAKDVPVEVSKAARHGGTLISFVDGPIRIVNKITHSYTPTGYKFPDNTDLVISTVLADAMEAANGGDVYEHTLKNWFGGSGIRIFVPDSGPTTTITGPDRFMVVTQYICRSKPTPIMCMTKSIPDPVVSIDGSAA